MIKIENLTFNYPKQKELFNNLNLQLKDGSVHGLLGKNGAGKTTLLKIIAGLRFPKKGYCRAYGYDTYKRYPDFLKKLYFIPEEFYTPSITIKEFIGIYAPFYPNFSKSNLYEYIKEFEIPDKGNLSSFSYGQKKKFLISFGLATNCQILILDEPTNGLDIPSKSKFRKVLASSINSERSFIISTHQVRDIDQLIDPIVILDEGEIIFNHSLDEISNNLAIQIVDELPEEDVLYSESTIGGYSVVKENIDLESTALDVETIFNAVINNKDKINQIFDKSNKPQS
ncbi:MAG: ABC transporter ATP-binding protein [Candidatus Marinimicrobia bacterium]|nr:ABC transporter ATP-binding protein [Candidatus Neomarinimicrobiota bacterium]